VRVGKYFDTFSGEITGALVGSGFLAPLIGGLFSGSFLVGFGWTLRRSGTDCGSFPCFFQNKVVLRRK